MKKQIILIPKASLQKLKRLVLTPKNLFELLFTLYIDNRPTYKDTHTTNMDCAITVRGVRYRFFPVSLGSDQPRLFLSMRLIERGVAIQVFIEDIQGYTVTFLREPFFEIFAKVEIGKYQKRKGYQFFEICNCKFRSDKDPISIFSPDVHHLLARQGTYVQFCAGLIRQFIGAYTLFHFFPENEFYYRRYLASEVLSNQNE